MLHRIASLAVVAAISFAAPLLHGASAATCSSTQAQQALALFKSAAARSGCAPYAKYSANGGVTISWSCATTSCTPTMMQLALQLPNCESATDGVNTKTSLEDHLYNRCQLCTPSQLDQIEGLWKAAAQTSACSKYATPGGTFFSWPCSATSCTATLKDLSTKVPSCVIGTQNERTRIINGISACTGTTVSTRTPSPASTSSGASTATPASTRPPVEATPAPSRATTTTRPPTSATSSSSSSSSSAAKDQSEASPAAGNYSSITCTATQIDTMLSLFVSTATSSNCKSYGTVSPYGVKISAPCSSSCVVLDVNNLAEELPDCYYAYENENKKKSVAVELDKCKPTSGRRLGAMAEKYLSLQVDSREVIKGAANSSTPAPTTRAPAASNALATATLSSRMWLAAALLALALAF